VAHAWTGVALVTAEETLLDLLSNDPALTAILNDRIYPVFMPQSQELPAVVYSRISTMFEPTQQGDSGSDYARIQLDIIAETYAQARAIRHRVRFLLRADATPQGSIDLSEPERGLYRLVDDYMIHEEVL
jgi:hypothetical protein